MQKNENTGELETTGELKAQIVLACQKLYNRGLVANHDGNITVKLPGGEFLATPTSFSKGDIQIGDVLTLDNNGKVIEGRHKVFSEISWHMSIYRVRPDVSCIVHAHPPVAGGFGLAQKEIGTPAVPEAIVSLGRHILSTQFISTLESIKAGGELDLELTRVLNESDAFIVPGNGAWTVGQNILQTYYRMELLEHLAEQHRNGELLGGVRRLPSQLVEELIKRRPARSMPSPSKDLTTMSSLEKNLEPKPAVDREALTRIVRDELRQLFLIDHSEVR